MPAGALSASSAVMESTDCYGTPQERLAFFEVIKMAAVRTCEERTTLAPLSGSMFDKKIRKNMPISVKESSIGKTEEVSVMCIPSLIMHLSMKVYGSGGIALNLCTGWNKLSASFPGHCISWVKSRYGSCGEERNLLFPAANRTPIPGSSHL